jgi:hypothetical protein
MGKTRQVSDGDSHWGVGRGGADSKSVISGLEPSVNDHFDAQCDIADILASSS